jgi:hypothetical protein
VPLHVAHDRLTLATPDGRAVLVARGDALLSDGTHAHAVHWQLTQPDTVCLVFRNTTDRPVRVEQLRPLVAEHGFFGAPLADLRISQTGWQSWSRAHPPVPFEGNTDSAAPPIRGPILPHRRPDSEIVPWMAELHVGAHTLVLGFLTAEHQLGTIEVAPAPDGHLLIAATELEGAVVELREAFKSAAAYVAAQVPA